ncbi:MAG: hypothetical protein MHPDNHAH_00706 [Anaerolineales bacterium]|nr:hypothetical protein [Anaerolineales bacterium]
MSIASNNDFEIAPGIKNTDWQNLKLKPSSSKEDWDLAICMFSKRIGRFLEPVKALVKSSDLDTVLFSGFAIIALDCLLIETLQSFRVGRKNPVKHNDHQSSQMIVDFLTTRSSFKSYFDVEAKARIFCDHFRNGILHQGEVKSSGRIRIDTSDMIMPSSDNQSLIVNRQKFHDALIREVKNYAAELKDGNNLLLREKFIDKMNEICRI